MAKKIPDFGLPSYESIFTTEEERQELRKESVTDISIEQIKDFKGHPFGVRMDDDMIKLVDSIKENGLLMPVLVRPDRDGNGYEMIAGHRRKFALQQLGITDIKAIVRNLDDDQATILMCDSNIQREHIYPTERGYAYKMRINAMKNQGKRSDLTFSQLEKKLRYQKKNAYEDLSLAIGESKAQIHRFIRITELIKPLQEMVDERHEANFTIAFLPAYELSFLKKNEQEIVVDAIYETLATPSLAQCQQFKRLSQLGMITKENIVNLLSEEKPNQREQLKIKMEDVKQYFPRDYTPEQMTKVIVGLLESWKKTRDRGKER